MKVSRIIFLAPVAVAACVQPPAPPPLPRPAPSVVQTVPPPPLPAADWSDRAISPGTWTYARDPRGSIARFGPAGADAQFTVRCMSADATIYLSRPGTVAGRMTVRATDAARSFDALPTGGTPPYVAVQLTARDPLLDAMAFSRGKLLIALDGQPDLIAPPWPEMIRVLEDCRG